MRFRFRSTFTTILLLITPGGSYASSPAHLEGGTDSGLNEARPLPLKGPIIQPTMPTPSQPVLRTAPSLGPVQPGTLQTSESQPLRSSIAPLPRTEAKRSPAESQSLPPAGTSELFPAAKAVQQQVPLDKAPADVSKPVNMGAIEYNENLAPPSNIPGLSVVQALNEALIHGPRAAAVRAQFAIARAGYATATQAPNPFFFFDRGIVAEQVNRIGPILIGEPPWKLFFRLLIAKRIVAQTKIDLLTTLWSLRADVRRAYVEVVVAQETQKTLLLLNHFANKLAEVAEKRFRAGDVPELDLLKAKLATEQAEAEVAVGNKRVQRARQQLNVLMGRQPTTPVEVPSLPNFGDQTRFKLHAEKNDILPDFERTVPALQAFVDRAMHNRLELKSLDLQIAVNNASLKGAYGNVLPNCSFSFGKSTAGNPTAGPKLTANYFTLVQEIPISNFNQGAIYQYKATQNQLKYQILAQENQITAEVSSAYNNLIAARNKIRVYQERLLADANEVARLSRRSYEVGQSRITASLAAQQENVQTQHAYLDAVSAYAAAFTDLEVAVGKPLQ